MAGLASLASLSSSKTPGVWRDIGEAVVPIVGAAVALKGLNSFINAIDDRVEKNKFNKVISYAKSKHPELRKVPHQDMKNWMGAFYTLSPKIAVNKELGSTMLSTVHDYGGNIDLATAKLIAETGEKTSKQNGGTDMLAYIGKGSALTGGRKNAKSK